MERGPLELKDAGVDLGKSCPGPMIDHRMGRERAQGLCEGSRSVIPEASL
jgi:hypothetical protein